MLTEPAISRLPLLPPTLLGNNIAHEPY